MRKNNFLVGIAVFLFCVLLIYVGITFYMEWNKSDDSDEETTVSIESDSGTESEPQETEPPIVFDYVTDVDEEILMTGKDKKYLLLVNKQHPLGADYEPDDMTFFSKEHSYFTKDEELESRTAQAILMLMDEMHACGITDVLVTSAYRSYERQTELFNKYVQAEMISEHGFSREAFACLGYAYIQENYVDKGRTQLSYEDARRVALSYSAEQGTSEHQTGLCVDFITEDMHGKLTNIFETKAAFAWLSENAHKFGFILRFPEGKEPITGYTYEPWHYRFVGREAATEIYEDDLTLEEYLGAVE